MPKFISDNDLYTIETLLADRHDGWLIGEIEKALEGQGLSFNRRTLQRRLVIKENSSIAISRMQPGTCRRQYVIT